MVETLQHKRKCKSFLLSPMACIGSVHKALSITINALCSVLRDSCPHHPAAKGARSGTIAKGDLIQDNMARRLPDTLFQHAMC